jgi:hypothetical protein
MGVERIGRRRNLQSADQAGAQEEQQHDLS